MSSLTQAVRFLTSSEITAPAEGIGAVAARILGLTQPLGTPVIEISGGPSSGKSTLAFRLCLAALREGDAAAWIDSGQGFCPLAAIEAGEPLERLLVVRVRDGREALRAADILLSSSGAAAVAVVSLPPRYKPPETALLRLQRLAERSGSLLLLVDECPPHRPSLGAAVALRLHVRRSLVEDGSDSAWPLRIEVVRYKGGPCGPLQEELRHGPDRLRFHRSL